MYQMALSFVAVGDHSDAGGVAVYYGEAVGVGVGSADSLEDDFFVLLVGHTVETARRTTATVDRLDSDAVGVSLAFQFFGLDHLVLGGDRLDYFG